MHIGRNLWQELCSYDNLFLAYKKARKHKTTKSYVIEFEKNLKDNLLLELHPDKTRISQLGERLDFLGFRVFYHYRLIKRQNLRKFYNKINDMKRQLYN